jgi:hypothetical protein
VNLHFDDLNDFDYPMYYKYEFDVEEWREIPA